MMNSTTTNWLDIIRQEADKTSIAQVARRLGYSRTAISLALSGKYLGETKRIEKAVKLEFEQKIFCPCMDQNILAKECRYYASGKAPTHNPVAMQKWRSCTVCMQLDKGE